MNLSRATLHATPDSLRLLRLIAADSGKTHAQVLQHLLGREWARRTRLQARRATQVQAELDALRAPAPAKPRRFEYPFHACTVLHISAAEHGFTHANLEIQIVVEQAAGRRELWPYELDVTPCHAFRFTFAGMPPQSGMVALIGMDIPSTPEGA